MSTPTAASQAPPVHDPNAISAWQRSLPTEYLQCRDFGHLWRPTNVRVDTTANHYVQTMRCGRCLTERDRLLTYTGGIVSSAYHYAEGYTAPHGTGRLDTADRDRMRLEGVLRLLGHDDGPDA